MSEENYVHQIQIPHDEYRNIIGSLARIEADQKVSKAERVELKIEQAEIKSEIKKLVGLKNKGIGFVSALSLFFTTLGTVLVKWLDW